MYGLAGKPTSSARASEARNDPYLPYNFLVEIDGLILGGFMEVSGLESELKLEPYEEGGQNAYIHQFPTRTTAPNLVLGTGLTDDRVLWEWYQDACQGHIQRHNGTVMLRDHLGSPVMWWNFKEAYPVKWSGPQFSSSATEVAIERIELVHRGITVPAGSQKNSRKRAAP